MNRYLSAALAGVLALSSCVYVRVKGNFSAGFLGEDDELFDLTCELEDWVVDPEFDLDVDANLWKMYATWTVRFAGEPAAADAAFERIEQAVLRRVAREDGEVTATRETGPREWSCEFRIDGEPGSASVRVLDDEPGSDRPHRIQVRWNESN